MADQFVVTFDGHLYELPGSCPLLLAQDLNTEPSFTLLLTSDPQNFLLIEMNNSTINIQHNGQVCCTVDNNVCCVGASSDSILLNVFDFPCVLKSIVADNVCSLKVKGLLTF